MWLGILLLLVQHPPTLQLSGLSTPTHCLTPAGTQWWVRQPDGALPVLWQRDSQTAYQPSDVLRFITSDGHKTLLGVTRNALVSLRTADGHLVPDETLTTFAQPLQDTHPWLPLPSFDVLGRRWTVFRDKDRMIVLPLHKNGAATVFADAPFTIQEDPGRQNFLQPVFMQSGNRLYAADSTAVTVISFAQAGGAVQHRFNRIALPETRSLEQVVPIWLPGGKAPHWLIYGGTFGQLNQFGWTLNDPSGTAQASGEGILVKHRLLTTDKHPRLLVFTVANTLSTHAFSRISGNTTFHCETLVFVGDPKPNRQSFSFKGSKDGRKPRRPVTILPLPDQNKDGFQELLVSDARRDIRRYLSQADGTFATQALPTSQSAFHRTIQAGDQVWQAWRRKDHWQLKLANP